MLVDTNVLSQVTRPSGDPGVIGWIAEHFHELIVPAPVVSELVFGAYKQRDPIQRERLIAVTQALLERCRGKIVPFDEADAELHGRLLGDGVRLGRTLPAGDAMIAAMALLRDLPVVTRNARHFRPVGVRVIDPWQA